MNHNNESFISLVLLINTSKYYIKKIHNIYLKSCETIGKVFQKCNKGIWKYKKIKL